MSLKDNIRNFFGLDETFQDEEIQTESYVSQNPETVQSSVPNVQKTRSKVIPMSQRTAATHKTSIHVLEPRVYSESEGIADYLLNNESVLLNFKRMERDQAMKVIDFLAGAIYAVKGDIQEVGEGIFLCTPANVDIANLENQERQENYY